MSEAVSAPAAVSTESTDSSDSTQSVESKSTQGEGQVKPDQGSKPTEIAPENGKRMFKVKVNGQDMEVSEDELVSGYQTRKAADEKFREAAMTRKQAEEFIHLLKTNPKRVLTDPNLGVDFRKLAEEYLVEQMQEEQMDPRDRELKKYKAMIEEQETQKKAQEKQELERQQAELKQKYSQDYSSQIVNALQSSGLPKTEHTVKRMAYYMHQGLQRGMSLKAADVVEYVKQDYINEQKALYSNLDGDTLVQLLGEDIANKLRKWDVGRVKGKGKPMSTPEKQPVSSNVQKSKKITKEDWKARMERIKNGEE